VQFSIKHQPHSAIIEGIRIKSKRRNLPISLCKSACSP